MICQGTFSLLTGFPMSSENNRKPHLGCLIDKRMLNYLKSEGTEAILRKREK